MSARVDRVRAKTEQRLQEATQRRYVELGGDADDARALLTAQRVGTGGRDAGVLALEGGALVYRGSGPFGARAYWQVDLEHVTSVAASTGTFAGSVEVQQRGGAVARFRCPAGESSAVFALEVEGALRALQVAQP